MQKAIQYILVLLLITSSSVFASHFVGGDVHFEQTGPNTYTITVRVFRDYCNGIAAETEISGAGIYDEATHTLIATVPDMPAINVDTINFGDECFTPTGICVEVTTYQTSMTLANNPNGYYFTYFNFARNNAIINMSPDGMTWEAHIPDPALTGQNSNPKFRDYPTDGYFCVGNTKFLDFSCTDADGDSLVYSLVQPLDDGPSFGSTDPLPSIPLLPFEPGYSMASILGPGSLLTINPATGIIQARPGAIGVYLFRVRCEEYRNGVKIGEVFGDFQYEAPNCTFDVPPSYEPFLTEYSVVFDGNTCFDVVATDPNVVDSFYLSLSSNAAQFGAQVVLPDANSNGSYTFTYVDSTDSSLNSVTTNQVRLDDSSFVGVGTVGARFCWSPQDCQILAVDSFDVQIFAYSIGCDDLGDTILQEVKLNVIPKVTEPYVPNVFSPNGDGKNDVFRLSDVERDRCYDYVDIKIYNRWGKLVYEYDMTSLDDALFEWDGKNMDGAECKAGTYFITIQGIYGKENITDQFPVTLFR